jgi:eukaryotic-like serine/threonine-protein kinase
VVETVGPEANYRGLELAPDGKHVAAHRHDGTGGDIWVTELPRGPTQPFTFDSSQENSSPVWSPDSSHIVFASLRGGKWGLYQKAANQAGIEDLLVDSGDLMLPTSWSPDGLSVVYDVNNPKSPNDIWVLTLPDRKTKPLLQTQFVKSHGQVSPNGRWLAYDAGAPREIFVVSFPAGNGKWQISTGGGNSPRWRANGRELFFMNAPSFGKMMAVDVRPDGPAFEFETPKELFDSGYINLQHGTQGPLPYHTYAVSADGQRFLIPRRLSTDTADAAPAQIAVVLNWEEGLRK